MSVQVETLEKSMAKLTIEVSAEEFETALDKAYKKNKSKISLPGFRKGKAPRAMIEKMYGAGVFYEDAANDLIPGAYESAAKESELEIVAQPSIDVTQIEKGKSFIFTADVATKPEVKLGEYKGLEVDKVSTRVTQKEVDAKIQEEAEKNAREVVVTDRAVADGDEVILDFEGFVDGEAFEGGKGTDYPLTLGSGSFIPGFEDQLVGAKAGDHVEVKVTFPEEYQAKELAGKEAVFQCDVKKVEAKELPELDDDFAQDTTEFDTLEEYKNDIKEKLATAKEEQAKSAAENALIEQIVESSEMDIPDAMVDFQVDQMVDEFKQRLSYQGLSLEQYVQFSGQNMDALRENMKGDALKRVQGSLVLEAIVAAENIEANEEDLKKEFEKMAQMYQMEASQIEGMIPEEQKENMKKDIAVQKAVEFVLDQANVTEATEELDFEEK